MEPGGSLPHSQEPAARPYPEPAQSSPCTIIIIIIIIIIIMLYRNVLDRTAGCVNSVGRSVHVTVAAGDIQCELMFCSHTPLTDITAVVYFKASQQSPCRATDSISALPNTNSVCFKAIPWKERNLEWFLVHLTVHSGVCTSGWRVWFHHPTCNMAMDEVNLRTTSRSVATNTAECRCIWKGNPQFRRLPMV
jgi:hypothetical protein